MKTLKTILFIVLGLIALPLIIALFLKRDFSVEREIIINKPESEVFSYVKYLKNQNNYSKWASMDPDMETYFNGTDGTAGFVSGWKSEKKDVGSGEQEITGITELERIDYEIRFIEPFPSTSPAYMTTDSLGESQTKVTWGFSGRMNYPFNLMTLFVDMEETLGADFETGLTNLKAILES